MKWATARSASEREALLEQARALGDPEEAAAQLGITRRHLTRLLGLGHGRDELLTVSVELPRELVEWLELEAVREKYRRAAPRVSKSRVVERLIRQAIAEEEE
jgi:hypothetical protein